MKMMLLFSLYSGIAMAEQWSLIVEKARLIKPWTTSIYRLVATPRTAIGVPHPQS